MADLVNLQKVLKEKSKDEFWAIYGLAIQSYASLEDSLCRIFASLSETSTDVASIIFFMIVNAGTLYGILEKLLHAKHGATFNLFWNSYLKFLRNNISDARNRIVHWHAWLSSREGHTWTELRPPTYGRTTSQNQPPPITKTDLIEFIAKCDFFTRLGNTFWIVLSPEVGAEYEKRSPGSMQTWRDICLQPVVYPPPSNHPLCRRPQAPESLPPPSPA